MRTVFSCLTGVLPVILTPEPPDWYDAENEENNIAGGAGSPVMEKPLPGLYRFT